ncbi:MAG TPA: TonB-dependent receptor, partial [Terriglobales bacterium]
MKTRLTRLLILILAVQASTWAQGGSGATLRGTVTDVSGAVIPGATLSITNPISGYSNSVETGTDGSFVVVNVPFNQYHLTISAPGFTTLEQDVSLRSAVPVVLAPKLSVKGTNTVVTVEASSEDLVENNPTAHTDVDSSLIARLPVQSNNSALSSVVALATPGVANDSNGLFHPQGEHADTSFSVDNQPITDQQSRIFSNQISTSVIDSMEVVSGVAPAEFGDKASLVIRTTTKSGLGSKGVHGSLNAGYGSFGTGSGGATLTWGNQKSGNFFAVDGIDSGRFLDTPEFRPIHAKGNALNVFDRVDYQLSSSDVLHLNLSATRSWFQTPNDYTQQAAGQDQRQELKSYNIAPGYVHQFSANTLLTAGVFVRQDRVGYYPSADLFADQPATLSQGRRLTNAGIKVDVSYVKGIHNLKAGVQFMHTFLSEQFQTGLTDPLYNAVCADLNGAPVQAPGITDPANCAGAGFSANETFAPGLLQFDLTRGGSLFQFHGKADIKQEALYIQDSLTLGSLNLMLGVRADNYNGLSGAHSLQPRTGLAYRFKSTGTVLRASYGRLFLTPYNENLILSSSTGEGGLATGVFGAFGENPLVPARRNHFEAGFQQALGKYFLADASYFWKFTDNDYDFDVLFNTPLAFPIQWKKSKIDGVSVRVNMPENHGVSAYSVMGHTRSRFFGPEVGGILFNSPVSTGVFRIDHDQAFQQTTHLQYQIGKKLPWVGFTWSYQSGMVAGSVPDYATALTFTGDQQAQIGLFCGDTFATISSPIRSCGSPNFGATRVRIPAAGTEDDDKNPPRIAPRHLFDMAVGMDNLLQTDSHKVGVQFTALNLTNDVALYKFLSTFSGT